MIDVRALVGKDPRSMTDAELLAFARAESQTGVLPGELPLRVEMNRQRCLDSPSYLATEILDSFYKRVFEPLHYQLMDDVLGPWLVGETVRIEGSNYDPTQYTGLLGLFSRSTLKSTILRMMAQWVAVYRKLREHRQGCARADGPVPCRVCGGEDVRTMYVHQTFKKAVEHSCSIKETAKQHVRWRETFPDFAVSAAREWDTQDKWRWPCFKSYLATEWSFTAYGETSSKEGGHYTERFVDDWVTEDSVTTPDQIAQSSDRFAKMDNLRDRNRPNNPWIAMGTHYHFQDCYKRMEDRGGWLVWRVPGHTGSPKRIFDLCSVSDRTEAGRRKIERGLKDLEVQPPGKLNFPKMLPWTELYRTARATGPQTYNCQILLNPVPEGEQRFSHEDLEASWVSEIPSASEMWLYCRVDPAISVKRDADETAIVLGGVLWDSSRWLIDGWIGREKRPSEILRRVFAVCRKWMGQGYRVRNIGIESVSYQEALAEMARNGVPSRDAVSHGEAVPMLMKPCAVRSIKRSADLRKHERLLELDGPVTRRELKFWRECPIAERVMQQFREFPFGRDDALDAVHDLWESTLVPPRPGMGEIAQIHPLLRKMLKLRDESSGPQLCGTHTSVRLAAWS